MFYKKNTHEKKKRKKTKQKPEKKNCQKPQKKKTTCSSDCESQMFSKEQQQPFIHEKGYNI